MTEFESATIAFQNATIAFQNASLWATYAQAGGAGVVGLAQCLLIAYGLKLMQRSNADRAEQNQLFFTKMDKQHEESMLALHQQGEALRQQGKALETLIERTAPR